MIEENWNLIKCLIKTRKYIKILEDKKEIRSMNIKQQQILYMLIQNVSIITLNINVLSTLIKREYEWMKNEHLAK